MGSCNGQSTAPSAIATVGVQPSAMSDASDESDASNTASSDISSLCDRIADRLELVAAWRHRPRAAFLGKSVSCDEPSLPHVCGLTMVDDEGLIGVRFPDGAPGAFFHFQLQDEHGGTRLSCATSGLGVADSGRSEPGVERCAPFVAGALAGMTLIVDSRCDRLRMTLFDDAYRAKDLNAGVLSACDNASPERLAAPTLRCPSLKLPAVK